MATETLTVTATAPCGCTFAGRNGRLAQRADCTATNRETQTSSQINRHIGRARKNAMR